MKYGKLYITPYLKQYIGSFFLAILFASLTIAASAMLTFTSGYLISKASLRPETILLLYVPIVGVRAFGISRAVFQYFERLSGHNAVFKILSSMRVQLYKMLEPQALFIQNRFKTGDLLGTLADDIEHLQDVYIRTIFPAVSGLTIFFAATSVLAVFDWKFALWIALCMTVIVFIYPLFSLYYLKKKQIEQKAWTAKLYQNLTDAVFGLQDWLISGKKQTFIRKFLSHQKESDQIERKINHFDQLRAFQLHSFSGLIMIMMAIWSNIMAEQGVFQPSYIAAFTLVTLPILEGLIPISQAVERIPAYQESLKRIDSIHRFSEEGRMESAVQNPPLLSTATIEVNGLHYKYPDQKGYALEDISLSIPQGKKIAILGKSGAGKSTFIKLLLGELEPESGTLTINGQAPQTFGERIFDMFGILNQKPYLFATTVENNIRLGTNKAVKEDIERVISQVQLEQYIKTLPDGLKTFMEEAGERFSGGERQRIALARILLKDTPIVILDEPTIGLDPITETEVTETIFDALQDKTVLWITHHLSGIEKMDQIIFLENGKVTMNGSHDELFQNNERYRKLYEMDRGL